MNKNFKQYIIVLLISAILTLIISCANQRDEKITYYKPKMSPSLILQSPNELYIDPQIFANRSAWPAVRGNAKLGETIYYRQYRYNRQSLYPSYNDNTYDLFQSYRFGEELR